MQAARPSPSPPKPWERAGAATVSPAPALPTAQSPATSTVTNMTATTTAPALPERPASMGTTDVGAYGSQAGAYGSRYGSTASPYGATASPYSRLGAGYGSYGSGYGSGYGSTYGSGYGMGGYGSSYGMGGYGMGMGGYGMGMGGMGMGGMGMPGAMGGVGPDGISLSQRMEAGTAATFQVIQSIVGAFGGFAQMLESTFMATHSSFFAMIGVAEQFGHLRNYLGQVLSIFALIRWCRGLLDKILGRETPVEGITAEGFRAFEAGGQAAAAGSVTGAKGEAAPKLAKKPLIVFLLTVIGLPYLMTRLVRLITARQEEEARRLASMPYDPSAPLLDNYGRPLPPNLQPQPQNLDPNELTFVRAVYPYAATDPQELSLTKDEIIAVLTPKSERVGNTPGWWKGRLRGGEVGWFPSTHVAELPVKGGAVAPTKEVPVAKQVPA